MAKIHQRRNLKDSSIYIIVTYFSFIFTMVDTFELEFWLYFKVIMDDIADFEDFQDFQRAQRAFEPQLA